jgi:hypothetical protein
VATGYGAECSQWSDWTTTSSKPVDPATTTSSYDWSDWESTTSSKPVSPATTSSSSVTWGDWEATTTSSVPVFTQTVVPVKPSDEAAAVDHSSAPWSAGYNGPSFVVSTAVAPTSTVTASSWGYPQSSVVANTPVAAASATPSSVIPQNVTPFTGDAAQQLPGTVLSVAVCVAVAVAGLLL